MLFVHFQLIKNLGLKADIKYKGHNGSIKSTILINIQLWCVRLWKNVLLLFFTEHIPLKKSCKK